MASIPKSPAGLFDIVQATLKDHNPLEDVDEEEHPQSPPIPSSPPERFSEFAQRTNVGQSSTRGSPEQRRMSLPGFKMSTETPSSRTGPPRSISYSYNQPSSPRIQNQSMHEPSDGEATLSNGTHDNGGPDKSWDFRQNTSPFRGALDYDDPEQREKEKGIAERKGKRRERDGYFHDVVWSQRKRLESPKEEAFPFSLGREDALRDKEGAKSESKEPQTFGEASTSRRPPLMLRQSKSKSMPHIKGDNKSGSMPKWGRLRSLLPHIANQGGKVPQPGPRSVIPQSVNITDELITGGLSALMLRLWFDRDERGHRRVPALFHHLKIRISDSLHPMHGHKAVFRIECEYANGAVRWVVYRQLREFIRLHTHYAVSSAYNRQLETLPEFPLTSLPYLRFLKERGSELGRAAFARVQREALENYLVGLIRAIMFHPAANRLAAFLELSALTIAYAKTGGAQYKAGILRISTAGIGGGLFGRRGTGHKEKKAQKWCAVRESYLVVLEEMGELTVWDVFLIDTDFKIERPTRYYRQGLNLFAQIESDEEEEAPPSVAAGHNIESEVGSHSIKSTVESFTSHIAKALHIGHREGENAKSAQSGASATGHAPDSNSHRNDFSSSMRSMSPLSDLPMSPILDPSTQTDPLQTGDHSHDGQDAHEREKSKKRRKDVSKHIFYIKNSQIRLKLTARNERQMLQWIAALEKVARESHYTGKNRFDSFAPIRLNVAAQWLVDGRDYFWNLSRAILLARESIHIHDWWLSPELFMRRPGKDHYRLDRLLERKAKEGVKIYIILYQEVSSRATPIDSHYAKQRLTGLHPNIMVQRSPSHFQTGTFYWAHHEKLCVIDQAIAFMGGIDACFGRWDTPQHVLVDDPEGGPEGTEYIWPGKDYSNPRIQDFHTLNRPDEDMYDRAKIPRMPWHDVSMQVVGQPARDLARHFIQRWNYLLRIKNHTRTMPFLLPPPEFRPGELSDMGLTGTCELQICRSAGPWSMGTVDRIEYSIQNAYLKAIQMSEHFVYIENQFFITSTVVNEVKIENHIGDALVDRIIRARREGTPWKCCIVIPLLPGFSFPVDHSDASAIRIILECQNRTLFRGPHSIFGRLRKEGIDPDNYIAVFSLRNWGKLRGDVLTTEQVYIHGKICIVDDRLAIIGSANINERSQRGDRDSEIAAVIRDTDMIDCTMANKPFKVGRFAHTLRVRLMREHIGVDVDAMYEDDLMASEPVKPVHEQEEWDPESEQEYGKSGVTHVGKSIRRSAVGNVWQDTRDEIEQAIHGTSDAGSKDAALALRKLGLKSKGLDATAGDKALAEDRQMVSREGDKVTGFPSSIVPTIEENVVAEHRPPSDQAVDKPVQEELENGEAAASTPAEAELENGELYGAPANASGGPHSDDQPPHAKNAIGDASEEESKAPAARATLRKNLAAKLNSKPWTLPVPAPRVDPNGFEDPICDAFWQNVWLACAAHNTEIYRKVFHAIPDDLVTTWKQYKEFIVHHERLNKPVREHDIVSEPIARVPSEAGDSDALGQSQNAEYATSAADEAVHAREMNEKSGSSSPPGTNATAPSPPTEKDTRPRKPRGVEPFDQAEREEMERLLGELCGHLVLYPTRFLEGEDISNNFLFNTDRLLPLPIYD